MWKNLFQLSNDACLVAVSAPSLLKMRELFTRNMTVEYDFMFDVLEMQASCHDIVIESAKQLRVSLNFIAYLHHC